MCVGGGGGGGARVCQLGSGWGLGEMELSVGSNMIHLFYFIYCCFSYGTCTCILYIVSCHNYMYYVCET